MSAPRRTARFAPNVAAGRRADARDANLAAAAADAPAEPAALAAPAETPLPDVAAKKPLKFLSPPGAVRRYAARDGPCAPIESLSKSCAPGDAVALEDAFSTRAAGDALPIALGRPAALVPPANVASADCSDLFVVQVPRVSTGLTRGVLRRHASGRTVLVMGGVEMDAQAAVGEDLGASAALGTRQVVAVCESMGTAALLGAPSAHLVFSPSDDATLVRLLSQ